MFILNLQKEAEYAEARLRILGEAAPAETASPDTVYDINVMTSGMTSNSLINLFKFYFTLLF